MLRVVFTRMKRTSLLPQYSNYKELIREAVLNIAHNEIYREGEVGI